MIGKFIDYLSNHIDLTSSEQDFVKDVLYVESHKKGDFLLRKGDISKAFFFNLKGIVRMFYTAEGEEKTTFFYVENSFVSSYESYVKQTPSSHYLECIEDCELVVITQESAFKLLEYSPKFESLARIMMEEELIIYQEIVASLIVLNPEKRYLQFLTTNKALLQRIPQYHIASYLGVNAESLSRIKKRIKVKNQIS